MVVVALAFVVWPCCAERAEWDDDGRVLGLALDTGEIEGVEEQEETDVEEVVVEQEGPEVLDVVAEAEEAMSGECCVVANEGGTKALPKAAVFLLLLVVVVVAAVLGVQWFIAEGGC